MKTPGLILLLAVLSGCSSYHYTFRVVDEESGKPLSGVTSWSVSSGHRFGCRLFPYSSGIGYYPPSGHDGLIHMTVPAIDGVSTVFEFQDPGHQDARTYDWYGVEPWHLYSYKRPTSGDIDQDRTIPSARNVPVVDIPLRRNPTPESDPARPASRPAKTSQSTSPATSSTKP